MHHHDNFVGDRLRLKTFLRVLENGKPKRPSRLKPRNQNLIEASDQNRSHSADNVDRRLDGSHPETNQIDGQTEATKNATRREKQQQTMIILPVDLPFCKPNEQFAPSVEAHSSVTQQQEPEEPPTVSAKVISIRKSGKTSKLTRSNEVRPPRMLELRRTETFEDSFHHHTRIALSDPIEHSQALESTPSKTIHREVFADNANLSNMKKRAQGSNVDTSRSQRAAQNPESYSLQMRRTGEAGTTNDSAGRRQISSATKNVKRMQRRPHGADRDGFTGSELSITPRSVNARRHPTHKVQKQTVPTQGVPLVKGLHPLRLVENCDADLTMKDIPSREHKSSASKYSVLHRLQEETEIRKKLSGITAPIRKESESSSSGIETHSLADESDMVDYDACFSDGDLAEDDDDSASPSAPN